MSKSQTTYRRLQWRMLLAVMFCYLFYYTGRQTLGFAIPGIEREFHLSKYFIGWISAGILWGYALGQAINGNLGDKFGARRAMTAGALLSASANWAVSFAIGFKTLLFGWWLNGYFQALGFAPGSRLIFNWWTKAERGKVYGLYLFAAGLSSVMAFVLALVVVDVLALDWRWIFRLPVLLLAMAGVIFYCIARDNPSDCGFEREMDEAEEEASHGGMDESSRERYVAILKNAKIHIGGLALGFQNAARYGLIVWAPVHFMGPHWKDGGGPISPAWMTIALPLGMAFGALSNGWLSDVLFRSVRWKPIALYMACAAGVATTLHLYPMTFSCTIVMLFLCGFFVYGPHSTFWALVPDLVGQHRAGTATGIMNCYAYVFAGLGEPLIGHLLDIYHDTGLIFVIVAVACILSGSCAVLIRR
ncbi:OPA family glycerol-3-phosphate transporter-like MFS transporter [Novosphingobium fluoreni]|uniref:OPA family glycerol-3-phosphate transporter-like MFS transporter n=1 Tax=Novosphingobium fluoreni TaxID=1391222 RepID=A0A7W6C130_9SPHN|nr:MFS transporter [Novosphingobium fluoreni]MBB3941524.1 OPA family glycerol-3-phosphate transporter-like MFS transporter [Novosphingobium fluoreni]